MDIPSEGKGSFLFYRGTLDCPAQIRLSDDEEIEIISKCGCCSFDDGSKVTVDNCRHRNEIKNDFASCDCHNTMIIYATCLSKRNHGACPYGLKGST
jgi:hypothetical protein